MQVQGSFIVLGAIILLVTALLHRYWPKELSGISNTKKALICFAIAAVASGITPLVNIGAFYLSLATLTVSAVASSYLLRLAVREYYTKLK